VFRRSTLALISAALLVSLGAVHADAASGDPRLQRLAQAQTELLLRTFNDRNLTGPANCSQGQDPKGFRGVYLLPTLLLTSNVPFASRTFTCHIKAGSVLVDRFGVVVSEDNNNEPYVASTGEEIPFERGRLEDICDDVLPFLPTLPLTVDGVSFPDDEPGVSTHEFIATVNHNSGPAYFGESRDLGHPGKLATAYCGHKTEVPLGPGQHVITVDFGFLGVGDALFTYNITVK
jgi:hypothetical protein